MAQPQTGAEYAGEVRARVESRLGFRVGGKLVQRAVLLGQSVQAGQVLAQLDAQDYQLAAEAARAQLTSARANRDLALAEFKRYQALKDQNFISGAELERREATLKAAQALVEQAQAQLASQANAVRYATLVADVAGVVTAVEAEVGQVLAPGMTVLRLAQSGARDVVFSVPEDQLAAVKLGTRVDGQVWASQTQFKARVREVAASADPVTRTFLVKAALEGKGAPELGSTVSLALAAPQRGATGQLKLPTTALRQDGLASAVWLLDAASMTVSLQPVQIASLDGNEVVLAAGLQAGQQVVVTGVHVLSPGQHVTIFKENKALAPVQAAKEAINLIAPVAPVATVSR